MWPYEEEKTVFPCLSKSRLKQKCGTYFFYRIIIVVFKYSHYTFSILRKHLAPFLAGLPCCLGTCYLFKCMGEAFTPVIIIKNMFLLVITVGNMFPLVLPVGNTFPPLITAGNTFRLVLTFGNTFPPPITFGNTSPATYNSREHVIDSYKWRERFVRALDGTCSENKEVQQGREPDIFQE